MPLRFSMNMKTGVVEKRKNKEEVEDLWHQYKVKGSESARDALIMQYVHLVKYAAGRIAIGLPSHIEIDDLFAAGLMGLIQAVEKFDPSRNIKFETYAIPRIKGAMLDELRSQDWFPRSIRHKAKLLETVLADLERKLGRAVTDQDIVEYLNISLDEYYRMLDDVAITNLISLDQTISSNSDGLYSIVGNSLPQANAMDPCDEIEEKELYEIVRDTLDTLPEKERLVLTLYYYEELTLKEIGKVLKVSESRVCQLHTKAMLRLKGRITRLLNGLPNPGGNNRKTKNARIKRKRNKESPQGNNTEYLKAGKG